MAKKNISTKLFNSTEKIANLGDFLLIQEGNEAWEIEEIHLTPKDQTKNGRVVCKWEKINGEWELICRNE